MSLNPDNYRFPLHPWHHPAANSNPHPHAVTRLEVAGQDHTFLLKLHERRIYFRRPESRPTVWALTQLLPETAPDLVRFWKTQVTRANFGIDRVVTRGYDATFTVDEAREVRRRFQEISKSPHFLRLEPRRARLRIFGAGYPPGVVYLSKQHGRQFHPRRFARCYVKAAFSKATTPPARHPTSPQTIAKPSRTRAFQK